MAKKKSNKKENEMAVETVDYQIFDSCKLAPKKPSFDWREGELEYYQKELQGRFGKTPDEKYIIEDVNPEVAPQAIRAMRAAYKTIQETFDNRSLVIGSPKSGDEDSRNITLHLRKKDQGEEVDLITAQRRIFDFLVDNQDSSKLSLKRNLKMARSSLDAAVQTLREAGVIDMKGLQRAATYSVVDVDAGEAYLEQLEEDEEEVCFD